MPLSKPSKKKQTSVKDFFQRNPGPSSSTGSLSSTPLRPVPLSNQGNGEHGKSHTFQYRFGYQKRGVSCFTSWTVLRALLENVLFKGIVEKNSGKEIVIQREESPRGAVNVDFPCCLIEKNELLTISFIKAEENSCQNNKKTPFSPSDKCDDLVTFNIQTKGGKGVVRTIMKNPKLKHKVDTVCVYAFRGETVKKALRRDGRFDLKTIFKKHCALFESKNEVTTEMRTLADDLDGKHFQVILLSNVDQPESQESLVNDHYEQKAYPPSLDSGNVDPTQHSATTEPAEAQLSFEKAQESFSTRKTKPTIAWKSMPNSKEVLGILRSQFGDLLRQLKEREHLRNFSEVQNFFREEYDKSRQSFSEVKKIKKLMTLSAAVCQIRVDGSARGTGFLLFDKFILTNAHVIYDKNTEQPTKQKITVAFDYEALDMSHKGVSVTDELVAYAFGLDDMGHYLDFALLELSMASDMSERQALLSNYSPPPLRGGIGIIGHPDGGVKKMDLCFVTECQKQQEAVKKHISDNQHFLHVMREQCLKEKWTCKGSEIFYDSCFFHGSSGSPVFDEECQLIGVHTGGYSYKGQGGNTRSILEYAYPMLPILASIYKQAEVKGKVDVLQYFQTANNMKLVLQEASNPQYLRNQNNSVIPGLDSTTLHQGLSDKEESGEESVEDMDTGNDTSLNV